MNPSKTNLKKNLKALKKHRELVVETIEREEYNKPEWLGQRIKNKDGSFNHIIYTKAGTVAIDDPEDVTKGKTNSIVTREKKPKSELSILIGVGCGHILNQILKGRDDGHVVVVVEPVYDLIKTALENYDMSKELEKDVIFATNPGDMVQILSSINESMVIESFPIVKDSYVILFPETYGELIKETTETLNNISAGIGTAMAHGVEMAWNDIRNMPYCLPHPGVEQLKDYKKGMPAVVVSTGPSLSKNLHIIKKYQDRIIIIAVGQAMRILLAHDIRPDFICSVDFGKTNMSHYEGLLDQDIPMVILNRTYAPLLQSYRGPKHIATGAKYDEEFNTASVLNDKGVIVSGGSVAHFATSLAVHLGCNPVILTGQDLALTGEKSHFTQADSSGKIKVVDGMIEWEITDPNSPLYGQAHSMGPAEYVEGYFGDGALTNCGLASFIYTFENLIKIFEDTNIINCTEGGANIKGAEKMSLLTAMKKHSGTIDKSMAHVEFSPEEIMKNVQKAIRLLDKDIENTNNIIINSEKGLRENRKCKTEKKSAKLKSVLDKNEKYSTAAHDGAKRDPLLTLAIYYENRMIHSVDMQADGKELYKATNYDNLQKRLKRNEYILRAALKKGKELKQLYIETKELLEGVTEENIFDLLSHKVYEEHQPTEQECFEYLKAENYSYPLTHSGISNMEITTTARRMRDLIEEKMEKEYDPKLTDKKIQCIELIEKARTIGREENKYEEAEKLLKKAHKLLPKEHLALWGLASSKHFNRDFKGSLKLFDKLIKQFPDNIQFQFEAAMVCLNIDLDEGLKRMGQVMQQTSAYDNHLARLSMIYREAGKMTESLDLLKHHVEKFPYDIPALKQLMSMYIDMDMADEEKEISEKLSSLCSTD